MVRVMWLLRRKPGISFEQFRDHYENSHAVLGTKYLGHLLLEYRRNYVVPAEQGGDSAILRKVMADKAWDYDCMTEWVLESEDDFDLVIATLSDPVIGKLFHDDEEHFLDRKSVRLIRCDQRETDTSACEPVIVPTEQVDGSLWDD